jgi:hypothetical protein
MAKFIENRIDNIITNLLPRTSLEGKFASPQSLSDRMRYYHTPGVSIAVINNFEIEWARGFGVCDSRFRLILLDRCKLMTRLSRLATGARSRNNFTWIG